MVTYQRGIMNGKETGRSINDVDAKCLGCTSLQGQIVKLLIYNPIAKYLSGFVYIISETFRHLSLYK